jgi:ribosomal-protein-alanine N-acetyltransferase
MEPLKDFLFALEEAGDTEVFYPHPFTDEAIQQVITQAHRDAYYVLAEGRQVLGYGMLRGWDEGFDIPSLGVAVHPSARGTGLGKALMHILHASARRKGATKVRLRVRPGNTRATQLYRSLGYEFRLEEAGYLVGFLDLGRAPV